MRYAFLICLFGFAEVSLFAQSPEAERIRELEQRVAKLESLVQNLMAREAPPTPITPAAADPAPAASTTLSSSMPQELLPNLGKIGASVNLLTGGHTGPFGLGSGSYLGGAVGLPLRLVPGGRLSYEISIGYLRSKTSRPVTSNVAQVANLAVLTALNPAAGESNLAQALAGTGAAPFPVTSTAQWNLQMLEIDPFSLKYTFTKLDRYRIRPYALGGLGLFVTITNQAAPIGVRPDANLSPELRQQLEALFGGQGPFGSPLIGGQIGAARELQQAGIPAGQGGVTFGFQGAVGTEVRVSPTLSFGVEYRYNRLNGGARYGAIALRTGLHF
jgi:opacity protein-like surface antigen